MVFSSFRQPLESDENLPKANGYCKNMTLAMIFNFENFEETSVTTCDGIYLGNGFAELFLSYIKYW